MVHDILVCEHTSDKSNMLNNMIQDAIEEQNIIWWNNKYRIEFLSKKGKKEERYNEVTFDTVSSVLVIMDQVETST